MSLRGRLQSIANICEKLEIIGNFDMIIRDLDGRNICRQMLDIERPRLEIVVHV